MQSKLELLRKYPLHKYLGALDVYAESGKAELHAIVNENTINAGGVYHGGALYTMLDVCAYAAILDFLGDDKNAVTHDIHVSLIRAAQPNEKIVYKSEVRKFGKTICFIDVEAFVGEKLIATASVTKSIISRSVS